MSAGLAIRNPDYLPPGFLASLTPQARETFVESFEAIRPSARLGIIEWAESRRKVATGSRKGDFRLDSVPILRGILEALDDPAVRVIVFKKCSQIGYTVTVALTLMLYHADQDPCSILVLFAKDGAGKRFCREKLDPTIRITPCLATKINTKSRNSENTLDYKGFPGGYIQLCGVGSVSNVKSTDARIVIIEEPDDVSRDVKGQGSSIALGKSRAKTFDDHKVLIGGTPTVEGFSEVDEEMKISDRRKAYVNCPDCGHEQTLVWEQVDWLKDSPTSHPVYGTHRPETARYKCANESCAALWSDLEKNEAIKLRDRTQGLWRATAEFRGTAGFDIAGGGELYSILDESRMERLVERYLVAKHEQRAGKAEKLIEFWNGTLARCWKLKTDAPEAEALLDRVGDYASWTCPAGGLVLVASVDVQRGGEHSEARLEYKFKVYGRGLESWRVAYGIIPGNPLEQGVWTKLEEVLSRTVKNHGGGTLKVAAVSIDSSDGATDDKVLAFCRKHRGRRFMAVKGRSEQSRHAAEIYTAPKPVDVTTGGKAAKYGVKRYMVGTVKAKDQIYGRLKLEGSGEGRMHFDAGASESYFKGLLAEAKIPGKTGRLVYVKKAGVANEPLDLEVMCLHAAHSLRLHALTPLQWDEIEVALRQRDLLDPEQPAQPATRHRAAAESAPERGSAAAADEHWEKL